MLIIMIPVCSTKPPAWITQHGLCIAEQVVCVVHMQMSCITECGLHSTQHGIHTTEHGIHRDILHSMDCALHTSILHSSSILTKQCSSYANKLYYSGWIVHCTVRIAE